MRKWGILITLLYAVIVVAVLVPAGVAISGAAKSWQKFVPSLQEVYAAWLPWVLIAVVVCSESLLLFLSVDTSWRRLKPRAHILISSTVAGILTALLFSAVVWSVGFALRGNNVWDKLFNEGRNVLAFWGALWVLWGVAFFVYLRNSSEAATRVIAWLLRGSVLELLIVVPCHIVVRRRHDCSAPMVTSFGIVTGMAIMLLAFGPSVLFLYKKRLDEYGTRKTA
jgi:hypothetical protein